MALLLDEVKAREYLLPRPVLTQVRLELTKGRPSLEDIVQATLAQRRRRLRQPKPARQMSMLRSQRATVYGRRTILRLPAYAKKALEGLPVCGIRRHIHISLAPRTRQAPIRIQGGDSSGTHMAAIRPGASSRIFIRTRVMSLSLKSSVPALGTGNEHRPKLHTHRLPLGAKAPLQHRHPNRAVLRLATCPTASRAGAKRAST